jgi:5-methylthioribose kinase
MFELDASNVAEYLKSTGHIEPGASVSVRVLSGGVSNIVLCVEPETGEPFVIKQSRERLRTEAPWFSRLDRIWRETAAMVLLAQILPPGAVPRVLFEDRQNYLFAMEAADPRHIVWKEELLSGLVRPEIGIRLAEFLSRIHGRTHRHPAVASEFDDREVFVQLRVDPFYRRIAAVHPELRNPIDALISEMWETRVCLVHADYSPKNVLVTDAPTEEGTGNRGSKGPGNSLRRAQSSREQGTAGTREGTAELQNPKSKIQNQDPRILLIDFETAHYGDPAFDLGFFLSHLLLKGARAGRNVGEFTSAAGAFWQRYAEELANVADRGVAGFRRGGRSDGPDPLSANDPGLELKDLERRTIANLAGCMLARIDGTSPVGYLPDPAARELVRGFGRGLFLEGTDSLSEVFSRIETEVRALAGSGERSL